MRPADVWSSEHTGTPVAPQRDGRTNRRQTITQEAFDEQGRDGRLEAEGAAERAAGKVKEPIGKATRKADEVLED
jgi:hypothetical protein